MSTHSPFLLRTLQADDTAALLQFELANREWFERHVAPRGAAFYSHDAVQAHIDQALAEHRAGRYHPNLLLDRRGAIVGRVNLKDIEAGRAEVGYRIAQQAAGRGAASAGLAQLIALARAHWGLQTLEALVAEGNPASARVLEKAGFVCVERMTALAEIAGVSRNGARYRLALSAATAD
ncbi:GNAT family protein [Paucibacter sp. APW11]|uniref:GNAT family protein n=1 Tax=Roseateles aquae TaxID=3077235 RepID=A0ABU3PHH2_9BURK|nr:GNAT family protein [Paucibacter sp. APW11]MDT9002025.1 GNAT family protein [Paucibacter sp. APW11]